MWPFATEVEFAELIMRTYADEKPAFMADAVYCYGQERENTSSVAVRAVQLLNNGVTKGIAIPTYGNLEKYNWFYTFVRDMLLTQGTPERKIVPIPHPEEFSIAHSHTEAIGLARFAKTMNWKIVLVTASPSHQLRAFIETITAVLREHPHLLVYSVVGTTLPWTRYALHSQGVIGGKRFEVIPSELKKILAYHLKGDLCSAKEALDYLNQRAK